MDPTPFGLWRYDGGVGGPAMVEAGGRWHSELRDPGTEKQRETCRGLVSEDPNVI
jgi:hypothetical protein